MQTSIPTPTDHHFSKFGRAVAYFCLLGVLALEFFLHGCLWFWIQNTGRNEYLEIAKSKIGCYHGVCGFGFRIPAKSCSLIEKFVFSSTNPSSAARRTNHLLPLFFTLLSIDGLMQVQPESWSKKQMSLKIGTRVVGTVGN